MREFIYYSKTAITSGKFNERNLMKAGRMDIVIHFIINSLFLSHKQREDIKLHLIFDGPPDNPKHLEICSFENTDNSVQISKKDISGLIKRMLYKYKKGKKWKVWDGYYIEKKGLLDLVMELKGSGKKIYILDKKGKDIRNLKFDVDKSVFLIGDHDGLQKKQLKQLKKECDFISLGKETYFASQAATLLNAEIDRKHG